jgi:hypothetical protein
MWDMALTNSFNINGIEFSFTAGAGIHSDCSGVTIHPRSVGKLDNNFRDALKLALFLFADFEHYTRWSDRISTTNPRRYVPTVRAVPAKYKISRDNFVEILTNSGEELYLYYEALARQQQSNAGKQKNRTGYVYLLSSDNGAYKIGRTKNLKNRTKTLGVQLPFKTEVVVTIATSDMHSLEAQLHQQYAGKRVNGEWFTLSPEDVEHIKSLAGAS